MNLLAQAQDLTVKNPVLPCVLVPAKGLAGDFQRSNASMAVALIQTFLASPNLPSAFRSQRTHTSDLTSTPQSVKSETDLPSLAKDLVAPCPLPENIVRGLERAHWPGRCQVVEDRKQERKGVTWFLDGAHTVESLRCCGEWFVDAAVSQRR